MGAIVGGVVGGLAGAALLAALLFFVLRRRRSGTKRSAVDSKLTNPWDLVIAPPPSGQIPLSLCRSSTWDRTEHAADQQAWQDSFVMQKALRQTAADYQIWLQLIRVLGVVWESCVVAASL